MIVGILLALMGMGLILGALSAGRAAAAEKSPGMAVLANVLGVLMLLLGVPLLAIGFLIVLGNLL